MQTTDTPRRALSFLDRVVLLRLDPDPEVALLDEQVTVGPNNVNPGVYLSILTNLELANGMLDGFGWAQTCSTSKTECSVPRAMFVRFQEALCEAGGCAEDRCYGDLVEMLDGVLDSQEFVAMHSALAAFVRLGARASCSSAAH